MKITIINIKFLDIKKNILKIQIKIIKKIEIKILSFLDWIFRDLNSIINK